MTNSEQETSNPLPKTYEEIHKQALDRRFFRPVESDAAIPVFIPVTDKNPEYSKLLNEVITLRWKCGDQAAEIARLQAERDAIVAWLRSDRIVVTMDGSAEDVIASAIEVGEHLKEYGK
jgi:hypothetical protein